MSTNFPSSFDNFTNPTSSTPLAPVHAGLHADNNDAIEALEAKVGANGSGVTTSHDYKLSGITGSDKAVSKTGTETLIGKTLTSPQINFTGDTRGDFIVRNASGITARFPVGSTGQVLQAGASGDPEWVANPAASDASTTIKGVSEEATLAETIARTGTGATGARLFVSPTTILNTQTYDYAADAGSTDAYAITVTPAPAAYVAGQIFRFKANTLNTGTATLNVNSLGAITIVKNVSTALDTGDILSGQIITVVYNGTNFALQSMVATTSLAVTYKSGTTSKSANDASTTQNIAHGLGKIPKYVKIMAQTNTGSPGGVFLATTTYDGTTQASVSTYLTGGFGITNNVTFTLNSDTTSGTQNGVVTFDATNIIITWTKTNSPAGSYLLLWEAQA